MISMRHRIITGVLVTTVCLLMMRCSSDTGNDVSGGTGTGNPPAVASRVMVIADTSDNTQALDKRILGLPEDVDSAISNIEIPGAPFSIFDEDSMELIVDSAVITARKIYFVTESGPDTSILDHLSPGISIDNQGMYLEGDFVFDALAGICSFSFDSLYLPEEEYTGLKLLIEDTSGGAVQNSAEASVRISGTFTYDDTLRSFSIRLSDETLKEYLLETDPVALRSEDEALFLLEFNARTWLHSVSFKREFDSEEIELNEHGNLVIEPDKEAGPVNGVESQIRKNLLESGSVRIFN